MLPRISTNRFIPPQKLRLPLVAGLVLAVAASAALAGIFTAQAQDGPPAVSNVEIISTPASGTSYGVGEAILVKVTFDQAVLLQGVGDALRPQLKLSIGAIQNRTAHNIDHTLEDGGNYVLIFRYVVTANDLDDYGISVIYKLDNGSLVNALSVPAGGRVYQFGGSADANLELGEHVITNVYGHRVNATTPEPPAKVRAALVADGIRITWAQPGRITPARYAIERRTPDSGNAAVWFWVDDSSTTYTDTANLTIGESYEYRVKGYQRGRPGIPHSSRISAAARVQYAPLPTPTPTAAPDYTMPPASTTPVWPDALTSASSGWAAPFFTLTHNSVTIYWSYTVSSVGFFKVSPVANGYRLYRRAAAVAYTSIAQLPLSQTSYQDTGLQPDTTYTYRIYEDHPLRPHNLIADLTFTTDPAPTPTPSPAPTPTPVAMPDAADDHSAPGAN